MIAVKTFTKYKNYNKFVIKIKYIHELVSKEENQMLKYKNFGRKSLTELVEKLSSMGLNFGMDTRKIMAEEG